MAGDRFRRRMKRAAATLAVLLLAACAATLTNHGYAPTDAELENIIVGVDNRASVEETIGRPASTGVLTSGGWYYVSSKVRHFAYRSAEVIDRQLVAVSFDKRGIVTNIERFTLRDGRVVPLSRRVTKSNIKGVSFLSQLLKNVGKGGLGAPTQGNGQTF